MKRIKCWFLGHPLAFEPVEMSRGLFAVQCARCGWVGLVKPVDTHEWPVASVNA